MGISDADAGRVDISCVDAGRVDISFVDTGRLDLVSVDTWTKFEWISILQTHAVRT